MLASTPQGRHAVGGCVDGEAFGSECVAHEFGDGGLIVADQCDARGRSTRRIVALLDDGHTTPEPAKPTAPIRGPPLPLRRYECRMSARRRVHASAPWMVETCASRNRAAIAEERSSAPLSSRCRSMTSVAAGRV